MKGICIFILIFHFNSSFGEDDITWENHASSSTNDLRRVFENELLLVGKLEEWRWKVKSGQIPLSKDVKSDLEIFDGSLQSLNFQDYANKNATTYVYHPVNAFHLMKRVTVTWPKILEEFISRSFDDYTEEIVSKLPIVEDFYEGTCIGLVNIELYYSQSGNTFLNLAKVFFLKSNNYVHTISSQWTWMCLLKMLFLGASQRSLYRGNIPS